MIIRNKIKDLVTRLPYHLSIEWALYCARDVFHLIKDNKDKEIYKNAIYLVEKSLRESVPDKEFDDMIDNIIMHYKINHPIFAVYYLMKAAIYGYHFRDHTLNTIYYSVESYGKSSHESKFEKYLKYLETCIQEMPRLERLVYDIQIGEK